MPNKIQQLKKYAGDTLQQQTNKQTPDVLYFFFGQLNTS